MECFDVEKSMWMKIKAKAIDCRSPSSRDGHACCNSGKDMYMHGGQSIYPSLYNYTYMYQLFIEGLAQCF